MAQFYKPHLKTDTGYTDLNVNYAHSADYASSANYANTAGYANNAGTLAGMVASAFATSAQGHRADTALQGVDVGHGFSPSGGWFILQNSVLFQYGDYTVNVDGSGNATVPLQSQFKDASYAFIPVAWSLGNIPINVAQKTIGGVVIHTQGYTNCQIRFFWIAMGPSMY